MEKFEVYSEYDSSLDLEICHARQFKDMIGVLGNFFIGERMFEVVLKMSIFHERKVEQALAEAQILMKANQEGVLESFASKLLISVTNEEQAYEIIEAIESLEHYGLLVNKNKMQIVTSDPDLIRLGHINDVIVISNRKTSGVPGKGQKYQQTFLEEFSKKKVDILRTWRGNFANKTYSPGYKRNYLVIADYIVYMDLIYNGDEWQRCLVTFLMLDEMGHGKITMPFYEHFWQQFIIMYGELLQIQIEYTEESSQVSK